MEEQRKTLNVGIVAHADAGKTTLTEGILHLGGALRQMGSVDEGTASTDTLEVEKQRGISVKTAVASVLWRGCRVNLIDTPGHSDFLTEVERSLPVLDGAVVVISAVEGIQPQTKLLLDAFYKEKLPCFLFLNKIDRMGSDVGRVRQQLEALWPIPLLPLAREQGEGEQGCFVEPLDPYGKELLEDTVMLAGEEALLEQFLAGEPLDPSIVRQALSRRVGEGALRPLAVGATKLSLGVSTLLDGLVDYLGGTPAQDSREAALCARVFRVEQDTPMGKAAWVRVFSGTIRLREEIPLESSAAGLMSPLSQEESSHEGASLEEHPRAGGKVARLRRVEGVKQVDCDLLNPGEVGVVYGLPQVRPGDLLGAALPGLREYHLGEPLMRVQVTPKDPARLMELVAALEKSTDEDPTLGLEWNRDKQELWVKVCGVIQLDVLSQLLLSRWGLEVAFSPPSVIYRETPVTSAEGFEAYTMPKPCWAVVRLLVESLPPGSGIQYESRVSPGRLTMRYQNHIATSVPRALTQGLQGWQVTDLKVTLLDGESHHVHTHPLDFFLATPLAVIDALRNAKTRLLEPILACTFVAPEESLGKTISLLVARRGSFSTPEIREGRFSLEAQVPAAEAMDLTVAFATLTSGLGSYASHLSHYAPCPLHQQSPRTRLGPNPLDRPLYILQMRGGCAPGRLLRS